MTLKIKAAARISAARTFDHSALINFAKTVARKAGLGGVKVLEADDEHVSVLIPKDDKPFQFTSDLLRHLTNLVNPQGLVIDIQSSPKGLVLNINQPE